MNRNTLLITQFLLLSSHISHGSELEKHMSGIYWMAGPGKNLGTSDQEYQSKFLAPVDKTLKNNQRLSGVYLVFP